MVEQWFIAIAESPLVYPALFALIVLDAFLVIVPSETALVALAALAGASGSPSLAVLVCAVVVTTVAAGYYGNAVIGGVVGDFLGATIQV